MAKSSASARHETPEEGGLSLLLFARFAAVEDPRRHAHKVVYPLRLLLLILFGAALSDMPGWQGAADFARLKKEWLRGLCPWEGEETPSADTFERVFGMLDEAVFAACFSAWMQDVARHRPRLPDGAPQHLAVDGKSLQGAVTEGHPTVPLHLVHTYLVEGRESLLVGLAPAAMGASGEMAAAADVLSLLTLKDTVVTGDANLLTGALADTIVEGGGGYVLALKGNRGPAHKEVCKTLCEEGTKDVLHRRRAAALCASRYDGGEEAGHGREEHRRGWAFDASRFAAVQRLLPHAKSVLALERERAVFSATGERSESCELHFFVSTLPATQAEALAGFVRAHWEVENGLHRTLDVVLHEDAIRIHNGPGAHNLAVVRRAALAALKADSSFKASLPRRVRQAAHDDGYRTHLLTLVIS